MKHELLVPVGNYESLVQAINNGADAVYLGGKRFGARAFANNFTLEELENATKLCHLYDVKIYVTVNTLIYENEFNDAIDYIKVLHKIGVDAVIMQDIGLINVIHQILPNLEIHASTQMHNHSEESLKFLENLGIKRVVFARELPLDYISNINTDLEKEVFIHGSLCVSYSGQCLFSSCILNRSGNRGECAGMCRLPYKLYENDKLVDTDGEYILSPKDLSSIDNFKELMDSNIKCFKIEGRMKSPEYVGIVTKIYKTLMKQYESGNELKVLDKDYNLLLAIFNREYTKGFLHKDSKIMNFLAPNHVGLSLGKVTDVTNKRIKVRLNRDLHQFEGIRFKKSNLGMIVNFMYDKNDNLINLGHKNETIYLDNFINLKELDEVMLTNPIIKLDKEINKKIDIKIQFIANLNKEMEIIISDNDNVISLKGPIVNEAINSPISSSRIEEVLRKTGNTPFNVSLVNIQMDENIFIPVGILNEFRRNVLDKLKSLRENKKIEYIEKEFIEENISLTKTNSLSVLVRTKEQLDVCMDLGVENIIVNNKELMNNSTIYKIPRDSIKHNYNYEKLLVTDYASLDKYRNNATDYFLNITNHYSLNYISKYANKVMLSVENSIENIKEMLKHSNSNVEVLIYGNIELMIMKYCPLNTIVNKDKICKVCQNNNKYYLKDRNNKLYRIENNKDTHSTVILNCNKTNILDKINELKNIGVTNFRIEFLDENKEEIKEIIERVKKYI